MQPLKGVVIGMGILIVIGMGLLVYGLVRQVDGLDGASASPASNAETPRTAFGEIDIPLPAGCRIAEMRPADSHLFLRLEGDGDCGRILVIDLPSGSELGRINLRPAP